ncbi:hypothetical protein L596_003727 [Steinernema carpocapsae]|uniref:G-protein coupled receptors family 1 profile domain-containing protein n=1 Tax=Steinernema carpocapsae TaxID=34508 RepID=A0A4U8UTI5_STECR|nr:hypothetical protein L596_003727 [Steinernema carpocapsae]
MHRKGELKRTRVFPASFLRHTYQFSVDAFSVCHGQIIFPGVQELLNASALMSVENAGARLNHSLAQKYELTTWSGMEEESTVRPQWRHPALALLFASLCIMTVAGNCLVVVAVCTKKYLRNPTGYLIVSLAFADLIVGLVVMPLNSLFEMTRQVWILGLTMCDLFHALDILASTSSIWNLCVISLDRYLAGQDPIGYRDKVSNRRITVAICFVWIMSACLSFPAILIWRTYSPHLYTDQYQCLFTDSWVYVVFSSLVSFYIPLILILFAYGRVFLIATRHSQSLKSGIKKVKCKRKRTECDSNVSEEQQLPTLRIHCGRTNAAAAAASQSNGNSPRSILSRSVRGPVAQFSSPNITLSRRLWKKQESCRSFTSERRGESRQNCSPNSPLLRPDSDTSFNTFGVFRHSTRSRMRMGTRPSIDRTASMITVFPSEEGEPSSIMSSPLQPAPTTRRRLGVREKSRQMMKYVHEQRAARTLSIVVGAFILCWMPFFIFSPIMALCHSCVANQEAVFSIITWAGHLNSMLNPLIYSRFSRDFRRAFKQILTCQRERPMKKAIKTPLSLVFAQLVSITQFWDQNQPGSLSTIVD